MDKVKQQQLLVLHIIRPDRLTFSFPEDLVHVYQKNLWASCYTSVILC